MKIAVRLGVLLVLCGILWGLVPAVAAASDDAATGITAGGWNILGYHTVRPGETLFCIGRGYGVDPWAIAIQNNLIQSQVIYSGMTLAIPDATATLPFGPVCAPQFEVAFATPPAEPAAPADAPAPAPAPAEAPAEPSMGALTDLPGGAPAPAQPEAAPQAPAPAPQPAVPQPAIEPGLCVCRATYRVVAGDTLTGISRAYGTNLWSIAKCSSIANVNLIRIGEVLCIP